MYVLCHISYNYTLHLVVYIIDVHLLAYVMLLLILIPCVTTYGDKKVIQLYVMSTYLLW